MFTGLIEKTGKIISFEKTSTYAKITVSSTGFLGSVKLGDSIAVNGVCLTVTKMGTDTFSADVSRGTIEVSTLNDLKVNSFVNLEKALTLEKPLGGHMVQGHVDGVGEVTNIIDLEKGMKEIYFSASQDVMDLLVKKGSIAVNGVSLTVKDLTDKTFSVGLIPLTLTETTLGELKKGTQVNLETDIIGKYVYKFVNKEKKEKITEDYLREKGLI